MSIRVHPGDGDGDRCMIRLHPDCRLMTDWWWGGGCIPVCAQCASLPEVTDASMRKLAVDGNWGPIPEGKTDAGPVVSVGDIFGVIRKLLERPNPQVCKHTAALDLIEMLDVKGHHVDMELVKALVDANDTESLRRL